MACLPCTALDFFIALHLCQQELFMHLHQLELVRVVCLRHKVKQQHMYNQHKQITQRHDKNMGHIFLYMIFIVTQQKGHHNKRQTGNAGDHTVTDLHLTIDIE